MAAFTKGKPKTGGRKPGTPNRIPVAAKEAVIQALNDGAGAVAYLLKLKNSKIASDRQAFLHLVGKIITRTIEADLSVSEICGTVVIESGIPMTRPVREAGESLALHRAKVLVWQHQYRQVFGEPENEVENQDD